MPLEVTNLGLATHNGHQVPRLERSLSPPSWEGDQKGEQVFCSGLKDFLEAFLALTSKKYYTDLQFLDQASQICCDLVSLSGPRTSQGPSRFVGTRRPPSCDRSLAVPGKTRSTDAWWLLRYYFGGPPGQPPSRSQVLKHLVQLQNSPLSTQTQLYSPAQTLCGLTPHSRPSS